MYIKFNENGIDENIVREKVNYFVKNNVKIQNIIAKLIANTNNIKNINSQLEQKAQKNEVRVSTDIKPINISEMDTETKKLFTGGSVPVVGEDTVREENIVNKSVSYQKTKGINYFNNINKTSNNFYKDIKFFETNNCNLEIRNGEVYFINTISKDWLYDDISKNFTFAGSDTK